jgi:prepilin-type N-terminal cleavage/methylation domain-containing protein
MPPRNKANQGFSLIEAVIVIAIMAILASAATPMLMRALTQQRTRQTRDLAHSAYEALVGARDRSVPNLVTDVGFVPPTTLADLRFLTTRNPAAAYRNGVVPPAYPTTATVSNAFTWGWNGPYWTGPIQSQAGTSGLPTDGWGRPFRWQANQIQSAGPDGIFGTVDDVVYPPAPAAAPASARLTVTVERWLPPSAVPTTYPPVTFTVTVQDRNQQRVLAPRIVKTFTLSGSGTGSTVPPPPLIIQPGAVFIQFTSSVDNQSQTITLAPGESRVVLFRTNL